MGIFVRGMETLAPCLRRGSERGHLALFLMGVEQGYDFKDFKVGRDFMVVGGVGGALFVGDTRARCPRSY